MVRKLKLNSSSKSKPTFFKVLTHDFTRRLKLPATFLRKYGKTLPKRCRLRTSCGEHIFDVRIEKTNGGKCCCFTGSGWSEFVENLGLKTGEIVVMWFDGELEFDVSVFQANNGSEKDKFCSRPVEFDEHELKSESESFSSNPSVRNEAEETEVGATSDEKSCLRFEIVLKKWNCAKVALPKKFTKNAGLIGKSAVVLKYFPKKQHWPILLSEKRQNNHDWFQLNLVSGWSKFRVKNKLAYGETYSFTFNAVENLIQVEPVCYK